MVRKVANDLPNLANFGDLQMLFDLRQCLYWDFEYDGLIDEYTLIPQKFDKANVISDNNCINFKLAFISNNKDGIVVICDCALNKHVIENQGKHCTESEKKLYNYYKQVYIS